MSFLEEALMKKNDIVEGQIQEIRFPNKGIVVIDGGKIIVKGGIEGQKVKVRITKKKNDKILGEIIEVIEKAPYEQKALCPHFGDCGGCNYQNVPYHQQLKIKEKQIRRLLAPFSLREEQFLGIEPSPKEWEYRNKMEFSFGDEVKGGPLALGMRKRKSFYEVVTAADCQIVDEDFRCILGIVLDYFQKKEIPFYHKKTHKGVLRHLVVRKGMKTGEVLVNLVTSSQMEFDLDALAEKIQKTLPRGFLKGFLHTIYDGVADVVKSDETRIIYGQDFFTEELLGLTFKISAYSFFQTNTLGAEKLYSIVRDFAGETKGKTIFDLYCGTGTISQVMAPVAKEVIGIEIVEEAVEVAKANAKLNGLDNCTFIAGDVLTKVEELTQKPDLIILDPPRDGIHPKAIHKIIDFGAPEIVYVSCKPTSLVRDLEIFLQEGYRIKKVKCMDMFPNTVHVESTILMTYCGSEEK